MKATDILRRHHRSMNGLFDDIVKSRRGGRRRALVEELGRELNAHMALEEETIYPLAARTLGRFFDVYENEEETVHAKVALQRLLETEQDDEAFAARLRVLKGLVVRHFLMEERGVFRRLNDKMREDDQNALMTATQRFEESGGIAAIKTAPRRRKTNGRMRQPSSRARRRGSRRGKQGSRG
jgi:hemerythrin superfamily protein